MNNLANMPWEETLDFLTADMDPQNIDIAVLADRYREYIDELHDFNMEVPARAIRVLTALLKFKTLALAGEETMEEEAENPMDFEEEEMMEDEEFMEEDDEPDLEVGPDLEIPVKAKPKRRMTKRELKDALKDAMEVKERREERQEMRQEMEDPIGVDEESLEDKINSLWSRLTSIVSGKSEEIPFDRLVEKKDSEEKLEKFLHVLQLENEEKVRCIQEDLLDDLHVQPEEDKLEEEQEEGEVKA